MNSLTVSLLLILCSYASMARGADECPTVGKGVFCYYASWAVYRNDIAAFGPENIDPHLCTHLIYSFAGLSKEGLIGSLEPAIDIDRGSYATFIGLKEKNPCLKTLLAIGGWSQGSRRYSVMASNKEYRQEFIDSVIRFLVEYGFDGIDIDWEYPAQRDGIAEDKENFGLLLKEMKETLGKWNLLVTIAVPISLEVTENGYDMAMINQYVDYVFIMAYDYTVPSSGFTGLLAPLDEISKTIQLWTKSVQSTKIVLGVPAYGTSFTLKNPNNNGIGAQSTGPGEAGYFTREPGFLSYLEVQSKVQSGLYKIVPVAKSESYYAYYGNDWIAFDMKENFEAKARYVLANNLGGAMVWSIDTEDYLGELNTTFPIINSLRDVLYG